MRRPVRTPSSARRIDLAPARLPRDELRARLRPLIGDREPSPAAGLDRLIHERARLGIVSALAVNPSLSFAELKALLRTTDGNLAVHARKLEEADYVSSTKSFAGRVPRTEYRLTPRGRKTFERYLDHMEALIRAARGR